MHGLHGFNTGNWSQMQTGVGGGVKVLKNVTDFICVQGPLSKLSPFMGCIFRPLSLSVIPIWAKYLSLRGHGAFTYDVCRIFWIFDSLSPLVCILDQLIVLNSRNLRYYICFWGTPLSPSHCRHHLYMPPNSVAGGVVGVASVPSHRPSPMTLHFKLAFLCFFVQGVQIGLGQKISLISN